LKIAVISSDDKACAELAQLLRERNPRDEVRAVSGTVSKLGSIGNPESIDALLLDQPDFRPADLEALELFGRSHPRVAFVVVTRDHSPAFLVQAMRAGVREVLAWPASTAEVTSALARIEEQVAGRTRTSGRVLAVVSCKGGSGSTFLATNLGYALSSLGKSVALIDLNLQFGDASLYVSDQKPLATLSQVCQQIHRLDASFLASSMLNVSPNYSLLAAPEDPTHATDIKPEHIDAILRLARKHYEYILIDVGRGLDAVSIRALDQADAIYPVVQSTLPYIRDGKRLLGIFRSLDYPKDKIHMVVNRYEKSSAIKPQDFQAAFGTPEFRMIPNHYEAAAASVAQGVPVVKLAKGSPLSKALQEFARSLVAPEAKTESGFVGRVFSTLRLSSSQA
jgi:pilus assembly protein CpaE